MKKSIFKNTIYKSILSFVNIVIPLLVGPYIVKLLDVELYGIYNKVYANFQLFLTFASFGIYIFGVREISKIRNDPNKVSVLLSNLFLISIITNVITAIIYIAFAFLTSSGITTTIYLIALIQLIGNIFYIEFVNEALENYKFITIKTLIVKILYISSLFIFVKKPSDIIIYAIIINGTVFLNNIISFIYAKKRIKLDFKNIQIKKYIYPLFIILLITNVDLLYAQLDRVMLGNFVNDVYVTMHYIPYYIVSTLVSIPYSIINVSIPRLSYLIENEGQQSYEDTLNKVISSLFFLVFPVCAGVFVLSPEVIYIYAGDKYLEMIPILKLACAVWIILSIQHSLIHLVMYPNNKEKTMIKYMSICGTLNLVLNGILLFFKVLTAFTALFTTGIVQIVLTFLLYRYARNNAKIEYKLFTKQNIRYITSSICFIPISYLIRMINLGMWANIATIILSCVIFYFGVLLVVKDENLKILIDKIKGKVLIKK